MLEPKPIGDDGGDGAKNPSDPAADKKTDQAEIDQAKTDEAEGSKDEK